MAWFPRYNYCSLSRRILDDITPMCRGLHDYQDCNLHIEWLRWSIQRLIQTFRSRHWIMQVQGSFAKAHSAEADASVLDVINRPSFGRMLGLPVLHVREPIHMLHDSSIAGSARRYMTPFRPWRRQFGGPGDILTILAIRLRVRILQLEIVKCLVGLERYWLLDC